jgi:hypothetical protein
MTNSRNLAPEILSPEEADNHAASSGDALVRLHAVSQAPINGLYQHQMGLGILGGRLYQGELEGVE